MEHGSSQIRPENSYCRQFGKLVGNTQTLSFPACDSDSMQGLRMAVIDSFGKVYFGFGAISKLGQACAELGIKRPLLATDPDIAEFGYLERAKSSLPAGIEAIEFAELPEHPTVEGVEKTTAAFKAHNCDGFVAIGGGSIIDNCKAATILRGNPGPLRQYAGHPEKVTGPTAPIIAVPTTAGTGAEMTRGGGIHPSHGQREFGIGGSMCQPKIAVCDPELTFTLPPRLTAGTGLDAIGHCIEGYLSPTVNPPVDAIALDGVRRVLSYIERAVNDGYDREARWNMMMAAVQGGMSIHKGLGLAHSLSITFSDSDLHHGALVTLCLPPVIRFVADTVPAKLDRLAEALLVRNGNRVANAIADLSQRVGLPENVHALGYGGNDIEDMAKHTQTCWFNRTSPRQPTLDECRELVLASLG